MRANTIGLSSLVHTKIKGKMEEAHSDLLRFHYCNLQQKSKWHWTPTLIYLEGLIMSAHLSQGQREQGILSTCPPVLVKEQGGEMYLTYPRQASLTYVKIMATARQGISN